MSIDVVKKLTIRRSQKSEIVRAVVSRQAESECKTANSLVHRHDFLSMR